MRMLFTGEETEKQRRPWLCANTGQQQLKCWGVISAVLLTNLKPSSMRAARKKSNSILSGPRAKRASLSAPTRSARQEQPRAPCVGISPWGLPVQWPSGCHSSPAQAKQEPGCACTPSRHTQTLTHTCVHHECAHVHGQPQHVGSSAGLQHPAPVWIQCPAAGKRPAIAQT